MSKWNILDSNGQVLQNNIDSYKEAIAISKCLTIESRVVLEETVDQQKEYFDKLKNDKEIAKKIISELVEYGLNKRSSSDSRTIFTKRSVKDLYSIQQSLTNNYKCHISNNTIWLDDYVMDIQLEGTKIVFNY